MRFFPFFVLIAVGGCTANNPNFNALPDSAGDGDDLVADAVDAGAVADLDACVDTLANVGAGDFTIRFRIQTEARVASTVLFQRSVCDASRDFWDIQLVPTGFLVAIVGQAAVSYSVVTTTSVVNDAKPHDVVVQRLAQTLSIAVDGASPVNSTASEVLGDLPPLGVATGNPCEGGGLNPLEGEVADVCITVVD